MEKYSRSFPPQGSQWLSQCDDGHPTCITRRKKITIDSFMPTRLIDIGLADCNYTASLVITKDADIIDARYLALSHRWSSPVGNPVEPSSTIWGSLEERLRHIDLDHAPANFRFARDVCRWLGVRYLWIDCYCIIQGSKPDWEAESSVMNKVYGGAYCTIAINRSVSTDSLFVEDFDYDPGVFAAKSEPRMGWLESLYDNHHGGDSNPLLRMIKLGPLSERAWCLQERQLSPRMLHFLDGGILVWECCDFVGVTGPELNVPAQIVVNQGLDYKGSEIQGFRRLIDNDEDRLGSADEVDCTCTYGDDSPMSDEDFVDQEDGLDADSSIQNRPHSVDGSIVDERENASSSSNLAVSYSNPYRCIQHSRENSAAHTSWYELVTDYTRRELTFETDRMIALGGLINEASDLAGCAFHYGIPTKDASRALLWLRDPQAAHNYPYRTPLPDIPSWSWLSIRGPVKLACSPRSAAAQFDDAMHSIQQTGFPREMVLQTLGSPQIIDLDFTDQGSTLNLTGLVQTYPAVLVGSLTIDHDLQLFDRKEFDTALHNHKIYEFPKPTGIGFLDIPIDGDEGFTQTDVTVLFASTKFGILVEKDEENSQRYRRTGLVQFAQDEASPLQRLLASDLDGDGRVSCVRIQLV